MDQQRFDDKYNRPKQGYNVNQTDFDRRQWEEKRQQKTYTELRRPEPAAPKPAPASRPNPFKQSGLDKFKDFDYYGAIEDFNKSIEIAPRDIATHFNLACAYSLTEDAPKAFQHLDKAVEFGFRDFQKLKEHHALAFIRIQKDFDNFEQNGFRLAQQPVAKTEELPLNPTPDLLDQLKKLGELREKGLLTEREFDEQKKKLLG
jgi:tetratricopeptide (TPR) repeat protein